ncbi:LysR family transcriptional regulator [Roseobacter sp. YSTF-M11]|uniref:LysR family transcriptional regulator n=1 Tax=Roseobacter insulae TaxID=2859783 RepID=A0A9X1FTB5_9RHOB|nr:LysR family transcriptional regulator [Roseobacter insulae]MBW4707298.1 LysR family transcriptional regulator [Roseobacter insulae]
MNRIVDPSVASEAVKKTADSHGLLHEMIRSFTTLARTLNLSHAVKELGSTRQTVRRHISQLEDAKGVALFTVEDRQYRLTEDGERALPEALDILARGNAWLNSNVSHVHGLQLFSTTLPNGWCFWQQQHSLSRIWNSESCVMRETLRSWAMAGGDIESPHMEHVRPYLIVYRHTIAGWICVEFGEQSFFVKWFGWAKARSSVGRSLGRMPGGDDFKRMLDQPFHEVQTTQSMRLDHVFTLVPSESDGSLKPVNYHRLMLGGRFPDGSLALYSLVEPSDDIEIFGLDHGKIVQPSADIMLNFDSANAKFER